MVCRELGQARSRVLEGDRDLTFPTLVSGLLSGLFIFAWGAGVSVQWGHHLMEHEVPGGNKAT